MSHKRLVRACRLGVCYWRGIMAIQVQCVNIVRYDPATGRYVYCNKVLSVDESKIGTTIRCPHCGGKVDVLPPAREKPPADEALLDVDVDAEPAPAVWAGATPAARPTVEEDLVPCINCHAPIPEETRVCPSCGHEQPPEDREGPVGFELWLRDQLYEEATPGQVLGIAVVLLLLSSSVCLTAGVILYGRAALWCLSPLVLVTLIALALVILSKRPHEPWGVAIRRGSHPWNMLLTLARLWGWRTVRWPFEPRAVLVKRGADFGDEQLLAIEDLDQYEVMDLEGTAISDRALRRLRRAKQLRFLIVRDTQVTDEGVEWLQYKRRRMWIWK